MASKKKQSILDLYMNYILQHGKAPDSVYQFCQLNTIKEEKFYEEYASFKTLEKKVFEAFFTQTIALLEKNEEYQSFGARDRLLSFYYTFFELLTANRTYVSLVLERDRMNLKNLQQLSLLSKHFKAYAKELLSDKIASDVKQLKKLKTVAFEEGAWVQLLLILKFWMEDESAAFEKTDVFIEKAVTTAFDLIDATPMDSLIDLGKFLYKEKMAH